MPRALPELQPGKVLLCFSHLRWDFVFQRPQHLLSRAAKQHTVIVFEEPIFECSARAHLRLAAPAPGLTVATPILPRGLTRNEADLFQRSLLNDLLARHDVADARQRERLMTWYWTPMALQFSAQLQPCLCVYDCMDELSQFKDAPANIRELERQLLARANLVFTGGRSLYEAKQRLHPSVYAFPSSIDVEHFAKARDRALAEPADQAGIPGPRLGFFGVIDERFDAALLDGMARLRPDWRFVMIGPVVKIDPGTLPRRENIHWLGQKSYDELPAYLGGWDVGIMPFALNEATRFISPTKTPEFLAAGLPVVSTAVPDVVRSYGAKGLVQIAATAEEMVARAVELLETPREPWLRRVDAHLRNTSWDRTWASMAELMDQQAKRRAPAPKPVATPIGAAAKGERHV
jgi:glycosyltransferase involved in cell wall biosynthesis